MQKHLCDRSIADRSLRGNKSLQAHKIGVIDVDDSGTWISRYHGEAPLSIASLDAIFVVVVRMSNEQSNNVISIFSRSLFHCFVGFVSLINRGSQLEERRVAGRRQQVYAKPTQVRSGLERVRQVCSCIALGCVGVPPLRWVCEYR